MTHMIITNGLKISSYKVVCTETDHKKSPTDSMMKIKGAVWKEFYTAKKQCVYQDV